MDTKKFYYAIIAIVALLIVFGCWKFLFGFVVAGSIFWYFGEEQVKKAITDVYEKAQTVANNLQEKVLPQDETIEAIITQSSIFPTETIGWYQIVIISNNKSYLLKPLKVTMLPAELSLGKPIKIITTYKRNGLEIDKRQTIVANGIKYEVV